MSEKLDAVQDAYAGMAEGDLDPMLSILADDVEWVEAEGWRYGGTYHGRDAVVEELFGRLGEEWSEWVAEPTRYVDGEAAVAVVGTYRGTFAETGESMTARFVHVWSFDDGVVTEFEQLTDTAMAESAT